MITYWKYLLPSSSEFSSSLFGFGYQSGLIFLTGMKILAILLMFLGFSLDLHGGSLILEMASKLVLFSSLDIQIVLLYGTLIKSYYKDP